MEMRQAIDDLRSSLEHITAEDELLGIIADQLTALTESIRLKGPLSLQATSIF